MKFRFVDQILSWEAGKRISGVKAVSFEEYCLRDALGMPAGLPESLLLQSVVSLADWLVMLSTEYQQKTRLQEIGTVQFRHVVRPGARVLLTLECLEMTADRAVFQAKGKKDDQEFLVINDMVTDLVNASDWIDAPDMRTLYSEISGGATIPTG